MDKQTEQVYQLFLTLLENLNLPENIFGFAATLLLVVIILSVKTIVLSCIVQKLKNCANSHTQFSCDNLEIVWTMQILEYVIITAGILFTLTFLWLVRVIGFLDCMVTSSVKSAGHCLTIIIEQSEQVLTESRAKSRHNQRNSGHTNQAKSSSVSTQLVPYTV